MDNRTKVKSVAGKIAFLMPHQFVNPDLEQEALSLKDCIDGEINKESPEYLAGAMDALLFFIKYLERKGPERA